jgi:hypothetical protein
LKKQNKITPALSRLIPGRQVFTISIIVVLLTVLSIWLFGLGKHRTIFENSLLSTTVLSAAFFVFLTIGLYKGFKLRDNYGRLTDHLSSRQFPEISNGGDWPDFDADDLGGAILAIILWIVAAIVITLFLWIAGIIFWTLVFSFSACLYWIFFRSLRLVFKKGPVCRGDLRKSMKYAGSYTILYNCWIYAIILMLHYF